MTEAEAVYVYAEVITSSPTPIPKICSESSMAVVAEFKQTALFTPTYSAILLSNSFVFGPVVIQPDLSASTTSAISSSVISGGEKGMFLCSSINFPSLLISQRNYRLC